MKHSYVSSHIDFILVAFFTLFIITPCQGQQIPYKLMFDEKNAFTGVQDNSRSVQQEHVSIGLFYPPIVENDESHLIMDTAQAVIKEANAAGGCNGIPFRLVQRWADNPWTAGSNEILKLVYLDNAVAIITAMSAESHLAAQIAAKAYIPVISAGSSDATLNQARLPWIFRLPPDDRSQAALLVKTCILRQDCRAGIISSTSQDSRLSAKTLVDEFSRRSAAPLFHYQISSASPDVSELVDRIIIQHPAVVFLLTDKKLLFQLAAGFKAKNFNPPLFLFSVPGLEMPFFLDLYPGKIYALTPALKSQPGRTVKNTTPGRQNRIGSPPLLGYTIDALLMIIEAARKRGPSRSDIRLALAEMREYHGRYAIYRFNTGGGNIEIPALYEYH